MRRGDDLNPYEEYPTYRPFQDLLKLSNQVLDSVQAAGSESDWFDCEGKYVVALSPELSGSNVTARIRVILKDKNGNRMYSDKRLIENTGQQEGIRETAYYHGRGEQFNTFGATSYKVLLTEAPTNSGFLSMFSGDI